MNRVIKIKDTFVFLKKSKIKAGDGLEVGKYPFYTSSSILSKYLDSYEIEGESLIFGTGGSASVHHSYGKFSTSTDCFVAQSNNKHEIDLRFVYLFLSGNIHILENGFKGAGLKHISKKYLEDVEIPLPPLETQKKIVEVLDKARGLIDARKEQIRLMDELIQSVFYEMFGDPVTNPKGWEVRTVEKVCINIMGGGTPSKSNLDYYVGDIPWVTPKDMKLDLISDSIDHINQDAINNSSAKLIPENSVLMVIRSGILKRKLPVAINKRCVAVNQDMKAFIINKNFTNSEFFMYFWKSCENYILSKVRAVTADNIEFKQIKDMKYILPPCELQNEFSEKVQQIQTNKILLEMSLCELENNLSGLMQSAFAGSLFDDLVVGK